jgi:hypothetical protein
MGPRRFSLVAAVIFAVMSALQLARALLGWPIAVTTPWGILAFPLWPNWIAFAAMLILAWLGYRASRS